MAEIRHLQNRHDVIFVCRGWFDLDKVLQTGAEWHVDCGDMVEIDTRYRIPIWRMFWRIQWHVIPEPCIRLQGTATWWIHCYDSRATRHIAGCSHLAKSMSWLCHIAECKISIRHIENRFSPYFDFFLNAVRVLTSGGFRIVSDTLVCFRIIHQSVRFGAPLLTKRWILYLQYQRTVSMRQMQRICSLFSTLKAAVMARSAATAATS